MIEEWLVDSVRPPTQFRNEVDSMLNAMRAFQLEDVYYVACPITGGYRHLDWLKKGLQRDQGSHRSSVIEPNVAEADKFCLRVTQSTGQVCINPATLYRPHWSQDDYRHFWSRVIQAFASRMYLSEGWEVSVGCLFECLLAIRLQLPVYDHSFERISRQTAIDRALEGTKALMDIGEGSEFLTILTSQFMQLGSDEYSHESTKR